MVLYQLNFFSSTTASYAVRISFERVNKLFVDLVLSNQPCIPAIYNCVLAGQKYAWTQTGSRVLKKEPAVYVDELKNRTKKISWSLKASGQSS